MILVILIFSIFLIIPKTYAAEDIDFEGIFNQHKSVMLIIHPITGDIYYANQAAADFYGYYLETLLMMNINQINTLSPDEVAAERLKALEEERNFFIFKHRLANGDIKTVHVYSYPITINEETYLFSIIVDQTDYLLQQNREKTLILTVILMLTLGIITTTTGILFIIKKNRNLKESEQRFEALHNASFGGIVIHDQGVILECNQGLSNITGYLKDELIGMNGLLLIEPSQRDFVMSQIKRGYEASYESIGIRKNGETYPVRLEARNIPYKGKMVRVTEFRDITLVKKMEIQLIESEKHLDLAMSIKNEGIWDWDLLKDTVYFDDRYYLMAGYQPKEFPFLLEEFKQRIHPDDVDIVMKTAEEYILGKLAHFQVEFRFMCKDKSWIWIQGKGKIVEYTDNGKPKRFIGTHTDINQQKQAEYLLRKSEEKFRIAQEKSPDGFTILHPVFDQTGEVIDFTWEYENSAIARINQTIPKEVIGKRLLELFPEHQGTRLFETYIDVFNTKKIQIIEEMNVGNIVHGEKWLRMIVIPMSEDIAILAEDITDRKVLENKLKQNLNDLNKSQQIAKVGTWSLNIETNEVFMSDELFRIYGFDSKLEHPSLENHINLFTPTSQQLLSKALENIKSSGIPYELELERKDRLNSWLWVRGEVEQDSTGKISYITGVAQDITERKNTEIEKEYLRTHDLATGLTNRVYFHESISDFDQEDNLPLSVINFDINGLRIINDAFGHEYGNQYIKSVSDILKSIFVDNCFVSRVGGDQFVVVMKNTDKELAEIKAKEVSEIVYAHDINGVRLSISYGIALKSQSEEDINSLFQLSEKEMYSNKAFESQSYRSGTIRSMIKAYHEKNPREEEHSHRVSDMCEKFAIAVNMSNDDINKFKAISHLHDIGKIAIDEAILNKPGKLTEEEWGIIKKHPEIGARILSTSDEYAVIADDILSHHERWDGKGYPRGIAGKDIPLRARMIAIIDSYDAMISDRPYRKAMSQKEAVEELYRCAGTQFDPELVDVFVKKVIKYALD